MEEDDYFLEEEEEEEESRCETNPSLSAECESSEGSLCPGPGVVTTVSRPMKKSTAFHDAATLEEQVTAQNIFSAFQLSTTNGGILESGKLDL